MIQIARTKRELCKILVIGQPKFAYLLSQKDFKRPINHGVRNNPLYKIDTNYIEYVDEYKKQFATYKRRKLSKVTVEKSTEMAQGYCDFLARQAKE